MRIGEFAEICGVPISVLRHYDKEGLLVPDFIDKFTGYRYYSGAQIRVFEKITALKIAGFSLKEIKEILYKRKGTQDLQNMFAQKKSELNQRIANLNSAEEMMLGVENMKNMKKSFLIQSGSGLEMRSKPLRNPLDPKAFEQACKQLEQDAHEQDCQRISGFKTFDQADSLEIQVGIDVIRLNDKMTEVNEDVNMPFENDEEVVGKWRVVGDYAVKEDFFAGRPCRDTFYGDIHKDIYFLPGGQRYWCYGWTKGFLLLETGDSSSCNRYEIENYDGSQYLFIENKSYEYRRGGRPTILVLRRMDRKAYTSAEIARKDDIDIPFEDDPAILGKWNAISFIHSLEEFDPDQESPAEQLYFKSIEFQEKGVCMSRYGSEFIQGPDMQVWTKGFVLRKWNRTACKYEIYVENGREYLIMEWKSGDYLYGGYDTNYYVFVRKDIQCPKE